MVSTHAANDAVQRTSEHNDTEDENRRSRISLACTRCRTRKDRCDGLKPSCTACRNAEKPCIYEATTKKRGLPEGYVRGLEKLIAVATQSVDGLENTLIKCLRDNVLRRHWNSPAAEDIHSSYWKDSRLHHELDILLSNTSGSSAGTKRKREHDDDDGIDNTSSILDNLKAFSYRVTQDPDARDIQAVIATAISTDTAKESVLEAFPPNSSRLFDLYFAHVHCWFPILSRPTVLKAYYESSRRVPVSGMDDNRALLWAVLAYAVMLDETENVAKFSTSIRFEQLALNFIPLYDITRSRQSSDEPSDRTAHSSNNVAASSRNGVHLSTETQQGVLPADKLEGLSIIHAQSLLILALLQLGNDCKLRAWTMIASARCILLANLQVSGAAKPLQAALQGCDLLTSFFYHEFGVKVTESLVTGNTIDEDGHEEWETWGQSQGPSFSLSIFNKLCRVLRITSETSRSSVERSHEIRLIEVELLDAGIPSVTQTGSPPHHIYFQLILIYAKFAFNSVRPSIERQELATQTFNLIDLCTSSTIGLEKIPPLLAAVFDLACEEANLASRQDLIARGTTLAKELSQNWPCFQHHSHTLSEPVPPFQNVQASPLDALQTLRNSSNQFFPIAVNDALTDGVNEPISNPLNTQNQWIQTPPNQLSGSTPVNQFDARSPNYSHGSLRNNSFGQINTWANMANFGQGARSSSSFPVPSPSFHGDEIDAIFHEMAHLDTNEWTNERALGLREFGFNDDSAFVEFCNDPERIALPAVTNTIPLSSTRQSWTFAAQPP